MPSCWPSTLMRAVSETFGKCRMVPSSILITRSLPTTVTTSPRSTCTSLTALPMAVLVEVWTCALTASERTTLEIKETTNTLYSDFIFLPPLRELQKELSGLSHPPVFPELWQRRERCNARAHCRQNKRGSKSQ